MLREENKKQNRGEWIGLRTVLASRPRFVMVELTRRCNLACRMCRSTKDPANDIDMDEGLFDGIAKEYFPYAELVDLHGYGESLLLPGILQKFQRVAMAGARVRLVTNLSLERPEAITWLARHRALVSASVDSGDPEILSFLRRGARADLIRKNLKMLTRHNARGTNILCTVQGMAVPTLEKIVDFAADAGVREVILNPVAGGSPVGGPVSLSGLTDEVDAAVARCVERARRRRVRLRVGKLPLGSRILHSHPRHVCLHPWAFFCIAIDGSVTFCDGTMGPAYKDCVLGNVGTQSFGDIWNGAEWSRLRLWHAEGRVTQTPDSKRCLRCYRNRMNEFDHLLEPGETSRSYVL